MGLPARRFLVVLLLLLALAQSNLGQRQRRPYHPWNRGNYHESLLIYAPVEPNLTLCRDLLPTNLGICVEFLFK